MSILLVTTRYPAPPRRGQQVRTMEWVAALEGRQLTVVSPHPGAGADPLPSGVRHVGHDMTPAATVRSLVAGASSGRPLQEALYASKPAREAVRSACRDWAPEIVVVQMVRCGWAVDLVRRMCPEARVVFDAVDSMALHFSRRAASSSWPRNWVEWFEATRCGRRETALAGAADAAVAVSSRDLERLRAGDRGHVIPVAGRPSGCERSPHRHPTVLLSGNLGYRPTVAAATAFAERVWPELRQRVPSARWVLAGARPARAIENLARRPGIEVHGDVPDLAPFLAEAWVAVAPMATGSGVPMKVLEAWAAGVPVVAHPYAAEGLFDGGHGAVRTAATPAEWIDAVASLIDDDEQRRSLASKGRGQWRRHYSPEVVAGAIRDLVAGLI